MAMRAYNSNSLQLKWQTSATLTLEVERAAREDAEMKLVLNHTFEHSAQVRAAIAHARELWSPLRTT